MLAMCTYAALVAVANAVLSLAMGGRYMIQGSVAVVLRGASQSRSTFTMLQDFVGPLLGFMLAMISFSSSSEDSTFTCVVACVDGAP